MERRALALAAQLTPAHQPTLCMGCFTLFMQGQTQDDSQLRQLRLKCHDYFSALMSFIVTERSWSLEDRAACSGRLLRCWRKCRSCSNPPARARIQELETKLFDLVYEQLCVHISLCFIQDNTRAVESNKLSKKGLWPTSEDDLFPFGVAKGVEAIVKAYTLLPSIACIVNPMLSVQRPLVLPELLKDIHRTTLVASMVAELGRIAAILVSKGDEIRKAGTPPHNSAILLIAGVHPSAVQVQVFFLWTMFSGSDAAPGEGELLVRGFELELYENLTTILSFIPNVHKESWSAVSADIACQLYPHIPADSRPKDSDVPAYVREWAQRIMERTDHYSTLFQTLKYVRARRSCWGPGCGKTVQETRKMLSLCAQCKYVQYCSKECQKRDWKSEPYPHKRICAMLHPISIFAREDMNVVEFRKACEECRYPTDFAITLAEWYDDAVTGTRNATEIEAAIPNEEVLDAYKTLAAS
ncbi:hypothetical protein EXIGLDRAFT_737105 [Exidia glandulosa HHB12029]|uniref:MYND-type domain-containing protein n=1 Tax=Exidia glandulosa HHB12029 TaxID=1314781 RepID=A0A166AR21_EXIGL|nr:hypothetical protein EXIGLDRAFT_737105 [Exidia glandulosa HHB12029]